jgi:hypothetical protein
MRSIILTLLVLVAFTACQKEDKPATLCIDGLIRWEGPPEADGLGWTVRKQSSDESWPIPYVLDNLPAGFQHDSLPVSICIYKTDKKLYCMCAQPLDKYGISSIRRR